MSSNMVVARGLFVVWYSLVVALLLNVMLYILLFWRTQLYTEPETVFSVYTK